MAERLIAFAAWASLILIAAATLVPIEARPHLADRPLEYLAAFALAGLLFGLAYSRHLILVAIVVFGSAVLFESLQLLTPDRHGRIGDLLLKLAGGVIGISLAALISRLRRRS